jgi:hypothetical protein
MKGHTMSRIKELEFRKYNHQPSWKRPLPSNQKGNAFIKFNTHDSGEWIEIFASEMFTTEKGRVSEKATMLTLDHAEAVALRDYLIERIK